MARQSRLVVAWRGEARLGTAWQRSHGMARPVAARLGNAVEARHGPARRGTAWQGSHGKFVFCVYFLGVFS